MHAAWLPVGRHLAVSTFRSVETRRSRRRISRAGISWQIECALRRRSLANCASTDCRARLLTRCDPERVRGTLTKELAVLDREAAEIAEAEPHRDLRDARPRVAA